MKKRSLWHIGLAVYLCLAVIGPLIHFHAFESSPDNAFDCPVLPDLAHVDKCCELHESGHNDDEAHHIHFLTENQTASARYNNNYKSDSSESFTTIDEVSLYYHLRESVCIALPFSDFYQDAIRPYSSGLSPPLS